ncbi:MULTISPECIES: hypothetical protein [Prevotellaceae]|uniref:Uncharacterized protein n=3 Tax=Segatella copri TaxID=165179 RepID=D1PAK3_9BACT|nr:hypothetical protein [Segatella copri]EFB36339.1 hypothetical protein PREVCOP_04228 [Segatella copri DSM 18205]MCF2611280.1 hypothetical protein [Segatella copri]MCW4095355.1 hypothetical protein [Segatella copri]MQP18793.1 hypothetical protein [Segatella copri DSM 18205]UEA42546.1 hypothetical protein LK433_11290 [Segatella copri DSM 18205]
MSKKIILACMCVLTLGACKKDYQKLATEFERALPDTVEVLAEQINEIDHFVYYKNKNNTELIRYNLETESKEDIKPTLEDGESIYGIYMGKENISFLKHDISEYGSSTSTLLLYNLKTQKFKEIESFFGADPVDAYADEKDKTITGFIGMKYAPTVKYVYDFDGNKISEEAEQVEAFNPDDILEDVSVASTQRQQETPLQEFRCRKCGQRVAARNTIEADIKARYGCEPAGSSHSWDYIQF